MDFTTISLIIMYLATFATSAVVHYPKVTEEDNDNTNENIRTIRNPEREKTNPTAAVFNPTQFAYQKAQQQDYLRQRYAEQQQINVEGIAKLRQKPNTKNIHNIYQHSKLEHDPSSEPYDWQPFVPSVRRRQERSSKEYIPLVVNTPKSKREGLDKEIKEKADLSTPGMASHIIYVDPRILQKVFELKNKQKKIQSRSISIDQANLVDSNSLSELLNKNPHVQLESLQRILQDPHQRNKIFPAIRGPQPFQQKDHTPITEKMVDIPNPRTKPNIEINHDQSQDQSTDSQSNQEIDDPALSSIIPKHGQTITKEAFEQIQKHLEQSSKYQVQDALLRAQQEAQAHVQAQHKAIEQAQRAILENVQKQLQDASPQALRLVQEQIPQFNPTQNLEEATQALGLVRGQIHQYNPPQKLEEAPQALRLVQEHIPHFNPQKLEDNPQALRLVQENIPHYVTHISVPVQQAVYPTPLPQEVVSPVHEVTIPTSNVQIHAYKTTSLPNYIPNTSVPKKETVTNAQTVIREQPQLQNIKIIKITPVTTQIPKHYFVQPQIKQVTISPKPEVQRSPPKQIEHYAPNHLHQAVAQLQAEKVLLEQVQSHNNAIINSKKAANRYVGQKVHLDSENEHKLQDKEAHGSANAYQHIILGPKEKQRLKHFHHTEDSQDDEQDDLQYAAKYAFGYRIKDNEEGNDFGHEEKRSGRSAEGSYQVLLPDGRRQKVDYYADDTGYHAKVTYENVATHQ